jgi:D-serine deaminase-like pyridoxal phosphate-dependent protein
MTMQSDLIGRSVQDLDTPSLLLDLDVVERNIAKMAADARAWGVNVRPHAKTHKTPAVAHMQLAAGAIGITCAKLGEAEVMADGGIGEILISQEIVGELKVHRLIALSQRCHVTTVIDDLEGAEALSQAAGAAGITLDFLVDVTPGFGRTGMPAGEPAARLAEQVARLPGLHFMGIQGYEGHLQFVNPASERETRVAEAMEMLADTKARMEKAGLQLQIVSTAGTGTCRFAARNPVVTEIQPGSYVVMDSRYAGTEAVEFDHSLSILTSVVSRAARSDAVIVDAGLKTLSTDHGPAATRGLPGATYEPAGDEHGRIMYPDGHQLPLGQKLELIPSHCDTTINLHDRYYVVREGMVVDVWNIDARGRIQ